MLREARYPEGDKYLAEYNGPFKSISKETYKAKPGSGLPDLVKTYTYGPCASPGSKKTCGKPASITDPGGHDELDLCRRAWRGADREDRKSTRLNSSQ